MTNQPKQFLTAEWRHLAMLNFEIAPAVLAPYVPAGTELDLWNGRHLVSVVGFQFLKTSVLGLPIPCHRNFEEVNLRFYVRRRADDGWRRGVVFIKEIVPRAAIAFLARTLYNEPYIALPMAHQIEMDAGSLQAAEYFWLFASQVNRLRLTVQGEAQPLSAGSEAEFITEHYWGYNRQRDGSTMEYRVEHPRWRVWSAAAARLECVVEQIYGPQFTGSLRQPPSSAFLAEGSAVSVSRGIRLRA